MESGRLKTELYSVLSTECVISQLLALDATSLIVKLAPRPITKTYNRLTIS